MAEKIIEKIFIDPVKLIYESMREHPVLVMMTVGITILESMFFIASEVPVLVKTLLYFSIAYLGNYNHVYRGFEYITKVKEEKLETKTKTKTKK